MAFEALLSQVRKLSAGHLKKLQEVLDDRAFDLGISKYSSGKIYGIRHKRTKQLAYTGSTIKSLKSRWSGHVSFFKTNPNSTWTRFINQNGGPNMFAIELVETYPCKEFDRRVFTRSRALLYQSTPSQMQCQYDR